jgi:hypothetical protein
MAERRGFARAAAHHETSDAGFTQMAHQAPQGRVVDEAAAKRRDERDPQTRKSN